MCFGKKKNTMFSKHVLIPTTVVTDQTIGEKYLRQSQFIH